MVSPQVYDVCLRKDVRSFEDKFSADEQAQFRGEVPATQLLVSADPNQTACYRSEDAISFYQQDISGYAWTNIVTLRSTRWAQMYQPQCFVSLVSPTPLLMMVAEQDDVTGTDLALQAYERAQQPKKLVMTRGGHFDQYQSERQAAIFASINWFETYL